MGRFAMKASFTLTETEMKAALIEYVKKHKGVEAKSVHISFYDAGGDPREQSSYSATVSE
jgi:hypothetical protein